MDIRGIHGQLFKILRLHDIKFDPVSLVFLDEPPRQSARYPKIQYFLSGWGYDRNSLCNSGSCPPNSLIMLTPGALLRGTLFCFKYPSIFLFYFLVLNESNFIPGFKKYLQQVFMISRILSIMRFNRLPYYNRSVIIGQ